MSFARRYGGGSFGGGAGGGRQYNQGGSSQFQDRSKCDAVLTDFYCTTSCRCLLSVRSDSPNGMHGIAVHIREALEKPMGAIRRALEAVTNPPGFLRHVSCPQPSRRMPFLFHLWLQAVSSRLTFVWVPCTQQTKTGSEMFDVLQKSIPVIVEQHTVSC